MLAAERGMGDWRPGAKNKSSYKMKCSTMADAKKSLKILWKKPLANFFNIFGCYDQTGLIRNHSVDSFVKETRCGVGKSL